MCLAMPSLYIEIDRPLGQPSRRRTVDVIVGNGGGATNHENFDALLEVRIRDATVCQAATNFVTPMAPGQSVRALRFELRPSDQLALEPFTLRASIQFWDKTHGSVEREMLLTLRRVEADASPSSRRNKQGDRP